MTQKPIYEYIVGRIIQTAAARKQINRKKCGLTSLTSTASGSAPNQTLYPSSYTLRRPSGGAPTSLLAPMPTICSTIACVARSAQVPQVPAVLPRRTHLRLVPAHVLLVVLFVLPPVVLAPRAEAPPARLRVLRVGAPART